MATRTTVGKRPPAKPTPSRNAAPPARKAATVPTKASTQLPATKGLDFAADAGSGMENTTADDFAIPFIAVLQKGSPQCDEAAGTQIEGAKAGMFCETASGALHEEIAFIPCAYLRKFIKWGNRNTGGGFKGVYTPEEAVAMRARGEVIEKAGKLYFPIDDKGTIDTDKSDILSDTREHYIILLPEEGPRQAILSLTSTQIKKSKQLNSALANKRLVRPDGSKYQPPTFASIVGATTEGESNDKGSWFGVYFDLRGEVDDPELYAMARDFHKTIAEGGARVDYNKMEQDTGDGAAGNGEDWGR